MFSFLRVFVFRNRAASFVVIPLVLLTYGVGRAAVPAPARSILIRNASDFWNVPDDQRALVQRIRFELLVYYYDPQWNLLWGESDGVGCYLPTTGRPLPLHSGERVVIAGTIVPAQGIDGDRVTVSVLADKIDPTALDTKDRLGNSARFDARWVTLEGYVCREREIDVRHIQLDVLAEGRLVSARVMIGETDPIPQLRNAHVRLRGVYVANRDGSGHLQQINAWIPRASDVTVLGWLDSDAFFDRPRKTIEQVAGSTDPWVRIVGQLWSFDPEHAITVRDATGQMTIRTQQPATLRQGDAIEVVGRPEGSNVEVTLRDPVFRLVSRDGKAEPSDSGGGKPRLKLRLAEQALELRPEQAAQQYPASLRGVVTWSDPKADFFFLQDNSGGIRIRIGAVARTPPAPSSFVTVSGTTANGGFAPELDLQELTYLSPGAYPPAQPVTFEEAMTGSSEGQRVEMRGYLRQVERAGIWLQLDLTTGAGEFSAYLAPNPAIESLVGSTVRIKGVCSALANVQRQLTGVRIWVADASGIQVEEPRPANPYSAPARTIANLRQFLAFHAFDHAVRLEGVVLYNEPGRYLYLQDGDAALLVLHRDTAALAPGESIEVVGFPGRDGSRLVLREAIWRKIAALPASAPLVIANPARLDPETDGRLVTIRARLQDSLRDASGRRLAMRTEASSFEALLGHDALAPVPSEGSVLELTGVYALQYDEYHHPRSFQLQLRSPADIRVVRAAPWWTAQRALTVAAAFALCTALGVVWVLVLRRRVRAQTAQIRAQLETETRLNAELERAARLESLGVLAGGIAHDFNNLLTVIMANLGLAAMDDRVQAAAGDIIADAERGARRAAELTQQLLTFAKGGDPVRRAVALPDIVRESEEFACHGSSVRCNIAVAPNLPPADADRAQISRVVHNLVLNATQAMADGGTIDISLTPVTIAAGEDPNLKPGTFIKLTVADNGPGIAPEHLARIFEPYFSTKAKNNGLGLATVHSIVKRHEGAVKVLSRLGQGTRFDVWLPAAEAAPASAPAATPAATSTSRGRILFLDDEEVIRRAAETIFRQLGHQVTVVADGAEAVREYERGLAEGGRFDVVMLDLTVPGGIGGLAVIEVLKRMDPHVRAIVCSGYSNDPVLANYEAYGFCAMVAKPYQVEDLARAIQDALTHRESIVPAI